MLVGNVGALAPPVLERYLRESTQSPVGRGQGTTLTAREERPPRGLDYTTYSPRRIAERSDLVQPVEYGIEACNVPLDAVEVSRDGTIPDRPPSMRQSTSSTIRALAIMRPH
jgi:hypothetical protein